MIKPQYIKSLFGVIIVIIVLTVLNSITVIAETNCFAAVVGASNNSNVLSIAYSCPNAEAVRISEHPNLIQNNWKLYSGPSTQQWLWLGESGTGILYVFFRQTNSEITRVKIPIEVPDSMVDKIFKGTHGYFSNGGSGYNYFPYSLY